MTIHIFDRSTDDSIKHAADMIAEAEAKQGTKYPFVIIRTDVVLMNGTNSGREFTLHVAEKGFTGDLWLLDVLSKEEHSRLMAIASRMRHNAIKIPAARAYIQERKHA